MKHLFSKLFFISWMGLASLACGVELTSGWYSLSHDKSIKELVKPIYNNKGRLVSIKVWTDDYIKYGFAPENRNFQKRRFDCKGETCHQEYPNDTGYPKIVIMGKSSYKSLWAFANDEMPENWMKFKLHKALSDDAIDKLVEKAEDDGF